MALCNMVCSCSKLENSILIVVLYLQRNEQDIKQLIIIARSSYVLTGDNIIALLRNIQ